MCVCVCVFCRVLCHMASVSGLDPLRWTPRPPSPSFRCAKDSGHSHMHILGGHPYRNVYYKFNDKGRKQFRIVKLVFYINPFAIKKCKGSIQSWSGTPR